VLRRRPLSLPYEHEAALIAGLLDGPAERPIVPDRPERFVLASVHHGFGVEILSAVRAGRIELPPADRRVLEGAARRAVIRRAILHRELPGLVKALGDPVLVKGPALAERYYADPRLRPFADLDLLVPRERLERATKAALGLGYHVREEFREDFGALHGHDVHLVKAVGSREADVEVHWRIGDDRLGESLDHAELMGDAQRITVGGAPVAVPDTPHQLLVVALHLLSDRTKRLIWVRDVELVALAADAAEWDSAFEIAERLGLLWVLHRALDYASVHLGLARPRPRPAGDPPPWGPLRAVEDLDMRASTHVGRLAALPWRERPAYLSAVLIPTAEGLRGTVGGDGAPTWRLAARHARSALAGLTPRRR
jgi:hypothetical protein